VIRASLHDRVAGPEMRFLGVEDERDLTLKDEAEVEGECFCMYGCGAFGEYVEASGDPMARKNA
jgi:hypothetical protein